MISVQEATHTILESLPTLSTETCPLAEAHHRTLHQTVTADRDLPPYDRIMMDGIALHSSACPTSPDTKLTLKIAGHQPAGAHPQTLPNPQSCIEVATGAALPHGADTIIPVEEISTTETHATISPNTQITPGKYIHKQASDHPQGTNLLHPGTYLSAKEIAVAASAGYTKLQVATLPKVALISTGDELVPIEETPLPHQIRQSNAHTLAAALKSTNLGHPHIFHLPDEPEKLRREIQTLLPEHDLLIFSGGVSKGKKDYLPQIFHELHVEEKLHWVAQRPGKPLWYGTSPTNQPLFALPGNPLSTLTCFHRYILPALEKMAGRMSRPPLQIPLEGNFSFPPPLTCFLPVELIHTPEGTKAKPSPANNSGDYSGILGTSGFIEIPQHESEAQAGTAYPFYPW